MKSKWLSMPLFKYTPNSSGLRNVQTQCGSTTQNIYV